MSQALIYFDFRVVKFLKFLYTTIEFFKNFDSEFWSGEQTTLAKI